METTPKKISLLYIEGNETGNESIETLLSNNVDKVILVNEEEKAYDQFVKTQPDIVMIDVRVSKNFSLKLIDDIVKTDNKIPIIVLTDLENIELLKSLSTIGLTHYLFEPIDNNILINTLNTVMQTVLDQAIIKEQNEKIKKYLEFIENKLTKLKSIQTPALKNDDNFLFTNAERISDMGSWKHDYTTKEYYWSDELFKIFDIPQSENSHSSYELFLSSIIPEDRSKVDGVHKGSLKDKLIHCVDYTLISKNGQKKFVTEKIETHFDEDNNPLYSIGTIQNINKYKQLHDGLLQNEEIMIAQSRYATMGEMISLIAHQWRQPITTISMSANNLMADIELDMLNAEIVQKSAMTITEQTQYLSKTIEDFRSFFKNVKQIEERTMKEIFDETSKIMSMSLKNQEIEFQLNFDNTITIKTYTRELLQVLINIIKNAKDALSGNAVSNKFIAVSITQGEDTITIEISDNAGGIKEEYITKIFDAYFTTKDEQSGTGLGLYMSKTIIEKHLKGKLEVENIENGVKFSISLPKILKEEK